MIEWTFLLVGYILVGYLCYKAVINIIDRLKK